MNVFVKKKETNTVIDGKRDGGVFYSASHYGIALFLSHLAHEKISCKGLRDLFPS